MRTLSAAFRARALLWPALILSLAAVILAQNRIDRIRTGQAGQGELLYFPSARFTKTATFGFTNLAADGIWLQVIQYYGKHSLSDREYRYLGHMFWLLSYLAPNFKTAYNFGALLLVTDANDPAGAVNLLDQGIRLNPDDWSIPFTKGFVNYIFLRDYPEAGRWFTIASRLPGAPDMAGRFAAFALKKGGDINTSRELWVEIFNKSRNQTEREIAKRYVDEIDQQLIIEKLNGIISAYHRQNGQWPEELQQMVSGGYLRYIPPDPLGGRFVLSSSRDRVVAAGGRNRKN